MTKAVWLAFTRQPLGERLLPGGDLALLTVRFGAGSSHLARIIEPAQGLERAAAGSTANNVTWCRTPATRGGHITAGFPVADPQT